MTELVEALDDDPLIRTESALNHYVVAYLGAQLDKPLLHHAVPAAGIDVCSAFFNDQGFGRHDDGVIAHVQQQAHFGHLAGKEYMVRVGHLGAYRECTGVGVYLRVGEVHESLHRVFGVVRQSDGHVRVPVAGGVLLAEIDVALAALEVVQTGHAEIHLHRVALDHRGQK